MMDLFKKSLDAKLAGSLFIILLIAFMVEVGSFSYAESLEIRIAGTIFSFMFIMAAMGVVFHVILSRPMKLLIKSLQGAGKEENRDLTVRLSLNRSDELGILAGCFDQFISSLNDIILDIGSKTETVTAASSEVFMASERMNEESLDLSSRSGSVAAAAEEMNSSMHTVAAASEEASTNISIVADAAGLMQSNISGIARNCDQARQISSNAKNKTDAATQNVALLGGAAREISKVTEVITDIAEQTNLLALNATIEAARAGEAGKGFAVVAGEIKNLASQTAQATESIRSKIEGIQKSAHETVQEVGTISEVISSVDHIVNQIAKAIEDQSRTATEVAGNIEQASIGISEVNGNVAQISQVASEIAKDIADVDAIASEMSQRSGNLTQGAKDLDQLSLSLRKMISIFRVSMSQTKTDPASRGTERQIPDLMPWRPALETKIEQIDTQHKELVRLINLLHRAMKQQKGAAEAGGIINDLARYTVFHFEYEEELFKKHRYPETDSHLKIHRDLVAKVNMFQQDFQYGKATITMELMDFLTDWLRTHIMKTDMAYVSFLRDRI